MDKFLFLFIKDLKINFILTRKLKEKGLKYTALDKNYYPYRNSLIVTDKEGEKEIKNSSKFASVAHLYSFLDYEKFPNYDSLFLNLIREIRNIKYYQKMTCALDPGEHNIGIAYFLENSLLNTELFHNIFDVVNNINLYTLSLHPKALDIKIGTGNLKSMRDLVCIFLGDHPNYSLDDENANIILVDEHGSSKKKKPKTYYEYGRNLSIPNKNISRDEKAAIRIGLRPGKRISYTQLEQIINREVPIAELKSIQRLSRKKSEGKYSVSRNLAHKIYLGMMTMEEALEIQASKNGNGQKKKKQEACN